MPFRYTYEGSTATTAVGNVIAKEAQIVSAWLEHLDFEYSAEETAPSEIQEFIMNHASDHWFTKTSDLSDDQRKIFGSP